MNKYTREDIETNLDEILGVGSNLNPVMFQYFKGLKNRELVINQSIDEAIIEYAVLPIIQWNKEDKHIPSKERKPITIYLSSLGGAVYSGFTLCDVIEQSDTPIEIVSLSYSMSMAALILMSGYSNEFVTRTTYPFGVALVHDGSGFIQGTAGQIKDYHNFNERYEERIKSYIISHSKITEEEYAKMNRREWYMDSDDMLKYGLIDYIIGA